MAIAKWIVAFVAVYGFGGVLADFVVPVTAHMHMKNPHWPPHAKFHNGQTMLMGVFAGTLSLCCLFAPHTLTLPWFFASVADGVTLLDQPCIGADVSWHRLA
jgi:hypothetical protein